MTDDDAHVSSNSVFTRRTVLKGLSLAPALALGVGTLAGCVPGSGGGSSGGSAPKLSPTPSASASGAITLWMRDDDLLKVFKTVVPAFNKKYPDVKVKLVGVDIDTKLPPTLISGTGVPDGSFYEDNNVGAQAPHLFDLSELMAPYKADTVQFKLDVLTVDQRLVGVPWDTDPGLLYYRNDILSAAGIDPANLTSYDALLDAARAIKRKNPDAQPIPLEQDANLGMQWLMMLINQQQGTGLVGADGKLTIDTPAYRNALTWIKDRRRRKAGCTVEVRLHQPHRPAGQRHHLLGAVGDLVQLLAAVGAEEVRWQVAGGIPSELDERRRDLRRDGRQLLRDPDQGEEPGTGLVVL